MNRKSISTNIKRELWAQCGGYCQNPNCNKYLFAKIDDDSVSLVNIAHIIGHGKAGPRSEHEIAYIIDKDGISNLIMLCLECHKIVDELEQKFTVEEMCQWKSNHTSRIKAVFSIPSFHDENELLREINELLDENRLIFEEYGPFSKKALGGPSGDTQKAWKRRCLDTILPNNQRIINLVESNRRNFVYPWELYSQMLGFEIHADSFRENCLLEEKISDYKLFPLEFDHFVKMKLGIKVKDLEVRQNEEIEYRHNTIDNYIEKFLANHSFIRNMEKWNKAVFTVLLNDGRNLRVFVTNTYYFTDYTFEHILVIDPNIDAIICSNPYSMYTQNAKSLCIRNGVGLFILREFMGAIRTQGDRFLNYLLNEERDKRLNNFSSAIKNNSKLIGKCRVYLFGSYLRHSIYNDIDVILVYKNGLVKNEIDYLRKEISNSYQDDFSYKFDFTICSESEFSKMAFDHDNTIRVL